MYLLHMSFSTGKALIQSQTLEEDLEGLVNLTHLIEHHGFSKHGLKRQKVRIKKKKTWLQICKISRVKHKYSVFFKAKLLFLTLKRIVPLHKCLHMICFVAEIKNVRGLNPDLSLLASYATIIKRFDLNHHFLCSNLE